MKALITSHPISKIQWSLTWHSSLFLSFFFSFLPSFLFEEFSQVHLFKLFYQGQYLWTCRMNPCLLLQHHTPEHLFESWLVYFQSKSLLMCLGRMWRVIQVVGSPMRPKWLLPVAWPNPGHASHCAYFQGESEYERFLLSPCLSNKR